jgi:hypothetical protein
MQRRFKVETHKASDTGQMFKIYSPTVQVKESLLIPDTAFRKFRNPSTLDNGFAVPMKRIKAR